MRDVIIVGSGAAGLAAAISCYDKGVKDILLLDRSKELGGILNQCIHNGFGLHTFNEELTGPEYASRFIEEVKKRDIKILTSTTVVSIKDKIVTYINSQGVVQEEAKAIILAMGSRERARGALNVPGFRPSGIFSAGCAQKLINIDGESVGKRVVILGSGDIGLIMARRLTLEGAKVLAVCEIMSYSGGLKRNIVQCLDDYNIPLYLSHTVVDIEGKERVRAVTIAKVDENKNPIKGSEIRYECDTLLLSVGLIPENELSNKANLPISKLTNGPIVDETFSIQDGIFACGNVLHIHDLVDFVSQEAKAAGESAASYVLNHTKEKEYVKITPSHGVRYTIPQNVSRGEKEIVIRFRVTNIFKNASIVVCENGQEIKRIKRAVLTPGEMESIKIRARFIANLRVEVEE